MAVLFGFVSLGPERERKGAVGRVEKGPRPTGFFCNHRS